MTNEELNQIKDLTEFAKLKGEFEAVKAERDYLRSLLSMRLMTTPIPVECAHEFDFASTSPSCRKCGALPSYGKVTIT